MKQTVVVIGQGEMGGVFARGLLRAGYPVYPVTRDMDMQAEAELIPDPVLVLLAVGEADLQASMETIPEKWRGKLGLLQNELLPRDWKQYGYDQPTVISVWFEKKKGQDVKVLIPSPVFGPAASILMEALTSLQIPVKKVETEIEMQRELVLKNVYIVTTNVSGLVVGGDVETLWKEQQQLAREVASDVIDIQEWLTDTQYDRENLLEGFVEAINGDPKHMCMGRSAPARLARAVAQAGEAGIAANKLRDIQGKQ
ncbi:MAG: hypothetical protein OEZ43_18690 [Gammaproteobacteria bacterium]|nr:hypothetical protein [Gammaproteobacteria bacterium]